MKTRNLILSMLLCFLCLTCNPNYDMVGMFNGTSPEIAERFADSRRFSDSAGVVHMQMPDNYRLFVCTDSHIDTTHMGLEKFIHAYKADTHPHMALHLGDLINAQAHFAHADSIMRLNGIMGSRKDTVFFTCGNHDIYFNQWHVWHQYYGSSTYWFDVRNGSKLLELFICIDTAEGTLGTEQLKWLRQLLADKKDAGYRRIIVFTHTHLFKQDNSQGHTSNLSLEETYELTRLLSEAGVELYLCGHDHSREVTSYGGVKYITVDACADEEPDPYYMVMEMGENISYEFISLLPRP
ncbi:MAG: metallophosphoesterase [Paludibacteraceae bacterium]|nr:metallophosphoesterase [Paludibacteraceae bacterium]